ncbi:Ribose-phosphate pyrophosphokinase [Mycoplasmopsis californica]|uniref:Ribose-phosphate pyrophosphokinase n=1 Tax=Mycoplasmopsis equigenitalium TaxID=114883 RepID=A0ABY5J0S0_9BACT|nr:ribose-phosphate pyrophosphokinase [Mycoplasmopsis equigenitalium]UUD36853.1 ribose-phosphate pyrophosphokinase [Mycoplasmopsis equigenitalium]VEU69851.1 Ribose-phosphate pyrophosphokinase [Mycoplasmopsis californica]
MKNNIMLFCLDNSEKLGAKIAKKLGVTQSNIKKTVFADGEKMLLSECTVRNRDVFIVANTGTPVNENVMELLIFIDSLKRASAKSINVVLTYYGYARQDRKDSGRQPIGAKLIANLLETAGATKIITIDLHNPSIQGFFDIPVDDLRAQFVLARRILKEDRDVSVVSPDHGGTVRARVLADLISHNIEISIIDKRRTGPNQTETMGLIGAINKNTAVIVDDIIDTGGTILKAAKLVKENGAKKVIIAATHGIFSRGFDLFEDADYVDKVIITDSLDRSDLAKKYKKLEIVSLDQFISDVIKANSTNSSVSKVYANIKDDIENLWRANRH